MQLSDCLGTNSHQQRFLAKFGQVSGEYWVVFFHSVLFRKLLIWESKPSTQLITLSRFHYSNLSINITIPGNSCLGDNSSLFQELSERPNNSFRESIKWWFTPRLLVSQFSLLCLVILTFLSWSFPNPNQAPWHESSTINQSSTISVISQLCPSLSEVLLRLCQGSALPSSDSKLETGTTVREAVGC